MDNFFTYHLNMRPVTDADLSLLHQWSNCRDAYGNHLSMERWTLDDCRAKFQNGCFWSDSSKTYLMELKEGCLPIGTLRYWRKPETPSTALIALKVAVPEYRGKGYGTEAQKGLCRELFTKYGMQVIDVFTGMDNVPEQRCLEKLDFEFVDFQSYQDQGHDRQGRLYRLTKARYQQSSVHLYYYA